MVCGISPEKGFVPNRDSLTRIYKAKIVSLHDAIDPIRSNLNSELGENKNHEN